jgi:choline kinase
MGYRVVIPVAGIGSRLEGLTKYVNKSLVGISNRPIISHLIEQFPTDCEFVIPLGYKGQLVKDFLELAYPNRIFMFSEVDPFFGEGSGLGLSLLSCKKYLQQPFVFISCDTLVKGKIPEPNLNWMGFAERPNLSEYRTLNIKNNNITEICEKGVVRENLKAYIGLAGISDFKDFWDSMQFANSIAIDQGEAYAMKEVLKKKSITPFEFTWFDTGNLESLAIARKAYSINGQPNILEKENEAIWFINNNVIKYSDDEKFIANRIDRVKELNGFVPYIYANRSNMYCYKKVQGEVLSDVATVKIFEDFLEKCQDLWVQKKLSKVDQIQFNDNCLEFYKAKTFDRVKLFYSNFNKKDNAKLINGEQISSLEALLNKIDWIWLCDGFAGRFHGDLHFENIIYSKNNNSFTFLDWRQDFAGDLKNGDIYYDLAKILHGLIVNHGVIANDQYDAVWQGDEIEFDFYRKQNLLDCERRFNSWLQENTYDLKKVRVLTALIFLNIAALHHYPYCILLYGLGKKMLKEELF